MKIIGLISTTARQSDEIGLASKIYSTSPLFRGAFNYCNSQYHDSYLLSYQHGILSPYKVVNPQDQSLNTVPIKERREWCKRVAKQIRSKVPKGSVLNFHAGVYYRELIPYLESDYVCRNPMQGKTIGKQLKFYKEAGTNNEK